MLNQTGDRRQNCYQFGAPRKQTRAKRPRLMTHEQIVEASTKIGEFGLVVVAQEYFVSRCTLMKYLKQEGLNSRNKGGNLNSPQL